MKNTKIYQTSYLNITEFESKLDEISLPLLGRGIILDLLIISKQLVLEKMRLVALDVTMAKIKKTVIFKVALQAHFFWKNFKSF